MWKKGMWWIYGIAWTLTLASTGAGDEGPFEITLQGPKHVLVGARPKFQLEIRNISDSSVDLVRPLRGSWVGSQYPRLTLEIRTAEGEICPLSPNLICGTLNPSEINDIFETIKPGQKTDWPVSWLFREDGLSREGEYRVVLRYDLRAPNIDAWYMHKKPQIEQLASDDTLRRLEKVPHVLLTSEPVIIQAHAVQPAMLERMIAEHFAQQREEFTFIGEDLKQDKWHVRDIRQAHGYISCLLEFTKEYVPALPKFVTPEYGFQEGRYLFKPVMISENYHWELVDELYALAPNKKKICLYSVTLPGIAAAEAWRNSGLRAGPGFLLGGRREDADILKGFLRQEGTIHPEQQEKMQEIAGRSQVIILHYERKEPLDNEADCQPCQELGKTLQSRNAQIKHDRRVILYDTNGTKKTIYPGLYVKLSAKQDTAGRAEQWVETMMLPVKAGFDVLSLEIIYLPSTEIKANTFTKCHECLARIDKRLGEIRDLCQSLNEYETNKIIEGNLGNGDWPEYPRITYRSKAKSPISGEDDSQAKAVVKNPEIEIWFEPASANPPSILQSQHTFARQGVSVCWYIKSKNQTIDQAISSGLWPLESYESLLDGDLVNRMLPEIATGQ